VDWRSLRIVAFDTETTGLNPFDGDRVIEFAGVAMDVDEGGRVAGVTEHHFLVNPEMPIPAKATEITGIHDDMVADAPTFDKVAHEVRRLLGDSICVAHNFAFDRAFLSMELNRLGLSWPDPLAEVDTVDLSIRYFSDARGHKLEQVANRLDVTLDGAHRATNDAEACGRCFVEMSRRFDCPPALGGLLDWADALGRPPDTGHFVRSQDGPVLFAAGPHEGELVEHHPVHLHWMLMAKERHEGAWRSRFPESVRRWVERYLRVRGSGRARQNAKTFGPTDWVIDSQALPLPERLVARR